MNESIPTILESSETTPLVYSVQPVQQPVETSDSIQPVEAAASVETIETIESVQSIERPSSPNLDPREATAVLVVLGAMVVGFVACFFIVFPAIIVVMAGWASCTQFPVESANSVSAHYLYLLTVGNAVNLVTAVFILMQFITCSVLHAHWMHRFMSHEVLSKTKFLFQRVRFATTMVGCVIACLVHLIGTVGGLVVLLLERDMGWGVIWVLWLVLILSCVSLYFDMCGIVLGVFLQRCLRSVAALY